MSDRVYIFDTTLRDGEQSPGCSMNTQDKLRMARQLVELGVDILEAGFPIASDGDFEATQAIAREFPWTQVAALARAVRLDVERALKALEPARRPRLHCFIATSDIHLKYKLKKTQEEVLEDAVKAVELARQYVDDVEFSAEDGSRTDPVFLCRISRAVIEAGARTVNIPDTVGYSVPEEYGATIGRLVGEIGDRAIVSVHTHDDLGLAAANAMAAVAAGARQIECTINGIGERAGNCSLEEVVMIMKTRQDKAPFTTGIRTELLYPASQLLTEIIGVGVQPNKAIVGRNAFAHEAGIHQDGYLKERTTYEIIRPETVGVPEGKLVLGKHSGRHALAQRSKDLGYPLDRDELQRVYEAFTSLADRKKGILDEDILALVHRELEHEPSAWRLESVAVETFLGPGRTPSLRLTLEHNGALETGLASSRDMGAALAEAVAQITGVRGKIEGYRLHTADGQPHPRAELNATIEGLEFSGSAEGPEPYTALTAAYLSAVNRYHAGVQRQGIKKPAVPEQAAQRKEPASASL
ncbi:MAG TPA: 2-isopropylmalate synthase [Bryobacterales bacterium]|nr:2-isopropylmalate synthase [Bryobacterales bacterium]